MRPELTGNLPAATGLDSELLARIEERARVLKDWLMEQGYTDLRCEVPISGCLPEGSEVSGTIDLLAASPKSILIIDHKSGGIGEGLDPYWPQLSLYAQFVPAPLAAKPLQQIGIFWLVHGALAISSLLPNNV